MGALDTIADKAADKIAQKVAAPEKKPLPQDPTQAAIAQSNVDKNGQMPLPLTTGQAAMMGLSGSDVPVPVAEAQMNTLEKTGHVVPSSTETPPDALPAQSSPQPIAPEIQQVPMIAKAAPTTKEMIAKLMGHTGPEGEMVVPSGEKKEEGIDWVGMLKGAGSGLGDFLQRWGLGLQGKGDAQTVGDIKRAQEFELSKQNTEAQIKSKQAAVESQYIMDRMNLQNQLNMENLPKEKRLDLENRLAELEANHKNRLSEIEAETNLYFRKLGVNPKADVSTFWKGGGS